MKKSDLGSLADELQPIAVKMARERGVLTDDQTLGVLLRIKPALKPVESDDPWKVVLSLPWSRKQRLVLEKLQRGSLEAREVAKTIGKEDYSPAWHVAINRVLREAGLKHRLHRQRVQYAFRRDPQNTRIWMEIEKKGIHHGQTTQNDT